MAKTTQKKLKLEEALAELNSLVERMEQGELHLEEALKDFERGVFLTRYCQKMLSDAEQKVQILMQREEQAVLEPYQIDINEND